MQPISEAIRRSDLVYYPDDRPGISRRKRGRGWSYLAPDGTSIDDRAERRRLNALAVPPAYTDVWISPKQNGHLLATGRDARDRKQYRYHEEWQRIRSETKYEGLKTFGELLPKARRRLRDDLRNDAGDQVFALACAVMLIDKLALRAGNEQYTEENGSFGTVTLLNRHVAVEDNHVAVEFTAKGGKRVSKSKTDRHLARMLEKVADLPGAELLSWIDANGTSRTLSSQDLNSYLATLFDDTNVTSKTFRTWAGSVAAFAHAAKGGATIKEITEAAAKALHNTPAIARKSYIVPSVLDLAHKDALDDNVDPVAGLRTDEARFLNFLNT